MSFERLYNILMTSQLTSRHTIMMYAEIYVLVEL